MKCKQCPEGRRFARGSIECMLYGMIIRADHEGTREGCERHAGENAGDPGKRWEETELSEDEWDAIDSLQGFFQEG